MRPTVGLGLVALLLSAGGCSRPPAGTKPFDADRQREAIEARAALVFTNALLIKPRETLPAADLAFGLAPLLVQEVAGAGGESNPGPATVWYELDAIHLAGITRPQMTYLWSSQEENQVNRGVRITLDARGLPAIWEVLGDQPGPRVMFVSQSLEAQAKGAFGPAVSGRRFAVEQPADLAPEVVVARVNEDGPTAMGPIIHLTAPNGEIGAVICRCMTTQACQLVGMSYYELKPLSDARERPAWIQSSARALAESLRWPPGF